jgi:hypothetical protein
MGLKLPPTHVDMEEIRNKYHIAEQEQVSYCRAGAGKAEWPEWPGELGLKTSICRLPQIVEIPG